jgi:hypothetical protein
MRRLFAFPASKSSLSPIVIFRPPSDHAEVINDHGRRMVQHDNFGNLNRKNEVLAMLEEIASRNRLDEHQIGLARILRFRQDHGLLHAALGYATKIERSSDILIAEALNVMVAQDLPVSIRASASGALGHLIYCRPTKADSDFDLDMVMESMVHVLHMSGSPAIKKALFKAIALARGRKQRNSGKFSTQARQAGLI